MWEFSAAMMFFHFYHTSNLIAESFTLVMPYLALLGVGIICFPVFGLLGDVVFGRYKTIKYSILIMWSSALVDGIGEVIVLAHGNGIGGKWTSISRYIQLCGIVGCASLLINSLQFGVDQLMDAPSRQITSFISWFTWCYYGSNMLSVLVLSSCYVRTYCKTISAFVVTVSLCVDILFNKELVKEPTSRNPLKLIFSVVRYAASNKYPHGRSAFSYWDHNNSRMNLSKSKYGGPFTHEEVEDVKTYFRMLWILLVGSFFTGYFIVYADTIKYEMQYFHSIILTYSSQPDFSHSNLVFGTLLSAPNIITFIGVPVFEFLVYPCLTKCSLFPIPILLRFNFGVFSLLLNQINYLALDVSNHFVGRSQNATLLCLLKLNSNEVYEVETAKGTLSYYWLYMPAPFCSLAYYLIFTSTMEFLCSQSPYSMRGLLMSHLYSFIALFVGINVGLRHLYNFFPWHDYCITLYCGVSTLVTALLSVVFFILSKWYSKRRRRDNEDENMPEGSNIDYYLYQQSGSLAP